MVVPNRTTAVGTSSAHGMQSHQVLRHESAKTNLCRQWSLGICTDGSDRRFQILQWQGPSRIFDQLNQLRVVLLLEYFHDSSLILPSCQPRHEAFCGAGGGP